MDRGPKEREVAASLRKIVRQTLTLQRLRLSQRDDNRSRTSSDEPVHFTHAYDVSTSNSSLSEDSLNADLNALSNLDLEKRQPVVSSFETNSEHRKATSHGDDASQENPTAAAAAIVATARKERADRLLNIESWSTPPDQFEEDQANLLMHYFDHVLPLQFSFYSPSIFEGGRGWLLSILVRTKPLYHVVLSLAAYHQQSVLVRGSGVPCKASLAKLQERHIDCINVLRSHLEKFSREAQVKSSEDLVDIMACICFLIALEVSL